MRRENPKSIKKKKPRRRKQRKKLQKLMKKFRTDDVDEYFYTSEAYYDEPGGYEYNEPE